MASCGEDTDPQLQKPTEFTLNTPALASQYYELTPDGTIDLTCTQPDYGAQVVTTYQVEASLDRDFKSVAQNFDGSGAAPDFVSVPGKYNSTRMQISADMLARSISMLRGIKTLDEYDLVNTVYDGPVYIRLVAQVADLDYTKITSNIIELQHVLGYRCVLEKGRVFLIGDACAAGWGVTAGVNDVCPLIETEIGNGIYEGYYPMIAGGYFRFYTALIDDWDANSYGPAADGTNIDVAALPFSGSFMAEKGNWICNWTAAYTKITADFNAMKVSFDAAEEKDVNAWKEANGL